MKTNLFNEHYDRAKTVKIQKDSFFNSAGYFWVGLTEKQLKKMTDLMKEQGAKVEDGWISLENGFQIKARGESD